MVAVVVVTILALLFARLVVNPTPKASAAPKINPAMKPACEVRPQLCTETTNPWNAQGQYTGHDEPSVLYYSNVPGSGNNNTYQFVIPKDPPQAPKQDGTGGTWNFQLRPTFWFGMIMCDNQDAPVPGKACAPDSDSNLYTSFDPHSPHYIGNTPGEAFMEMQFYPPGWDPISQVPDDTQWASALTIDSDQENLNTGAQNNAACGNIVGPEPVNYAIVTRSGHSQVPAWPFEGFGNQAQTTPDTLEMNGGDKIVLDMHDTPAGFQVVVHDLTTGQTGSMTASVANGFGHALFQPNSATCNGQFYAYHPMFSTSTPQTRVFWAAHSYNVAMSDEIGHFEYCNAASTDPNTGFACTEPGVTDPSGVDDDDFFCFTSGPETLTGCVSEDTDFDSTSYQHDWPGSLPNPHQDQQVHAAPLMFTSPQFKLAGHSSLLLNYQRVAFETDLPRIEGADVSDNNACQRHVFNPSDPNPGQGCVNPPVGANFYPFYSTTFVHGVCYWQEGDKYLPNQVNNFGGSSKSEYGNLLLSIYPTVGGTEGIYENFHRDLFYNPCPAFGTH
jgi:hypothetical protein